MTNNNRGATEFGVMLSTLSELRTEDFPGGLAVGTITGGDEVQEVLVTIYEATLTSLIDYGITHLRPFDQERDGHFLDRRSAGARQSGGEGFLELLRSGCRGGLPFGKGGPFVFWQFSGPRHQHVFGIVPDIPDPDMVVSGCGKTNQGFRIDAQLDAARAHLAGSGSDEGWVDWPGVEDESAIDNPVLRAYLTGLEPGSTE